MNDRSAVMREQGSKSGIPLPHQLGGQRAHVDPLEDGHPLVGAQPLVQLPVPDIDGVDVGCPPLEQAVGEAPGRCTRIERAPAGGSDGEPGEGGIELLPAPADERLGRPPQDDGLVGRHLARRLVGLGPRHQDHPGRDGYLGLVPVGDQAPPYELGVEPPTRPWAQLLLDPLASVGGALLGRGLLGRGAFLAAGAFLVATVLAAAFLAAARCEGALALCTCTGTGGGLGGASSLPSSWWRTG